MKYNHTNRISLPCYENVFRTWPLYEVECKDFNHTLRRRNIEEVPPPISSTHIHRDYTEDIQTQRISHKNEYLVLNFLSNLGAYEHNLLAYERDITGCKFAPGVNLLPGANLHPGANCAHEHGLRQIETRRCLSQD